MSEHVPHFKKMAGFTLSLLVIHHLLIFNIEPRSKLIPEFFIDFLFMFWPCYFVVMSIFSLYYYFKGNQPYAISFFLTMMMAAVFGFSSCWITFARWPH